MKECNGEDAQTHTNPGETAELTDRHMTEEHVKSKAILVGLIVTEWSVIKVVIKKEPH